MNINKRVARLVRIIAELEGKYPSELGNLGLVALRRRLIWLKNKESHEKK